MTIVVFQMYLFELLEYILKVSIVHGYILYIRYIASIYIIILCKEYIYFILDCVKKKYQYLCAVAEEWICGHSNDLQIQLSRWKKLLQSEIWLSNYIYIQ